MTSSSTQSNCTPASQDNASPALFPRRITCTGKRLVTGRPCSHAPGKTAT
ncbi:hypothetical protein LHK_00178 [Laribacter hongkongensis HLHK9]|uniref:Uncharacterized protein n=1 Tax=Laribacter hongkongensis (strain HLHK9) TaxID=557598 RepID=C1DAJ3_LARHH|nr:hypothetical protein LHK_00178 [Laribacter hongkongensis HLHK9]